MTSEATPPTPPSRRAFTLEDLQRLTPGLGTIMPEIGLRTWKLHYAAQAQNWPLAQFEVGEIRGLMLRGAFTRPAYEGDLKSFVDDFVSKVAEAVEKKDLASFDAAFTEMVSMANEFHDGVDHGFIVWKLPDYPPPDLDLTPRG
jgi:hypothetical protein